MKRIVAATILLALGGFARDASAQSLQGSDTLADVARDLIASGSCGTGLTYVGGGTGKGEAAMIAGAQQIAPITRALSNNSTNPTTCNGNEGTAAGIVIGLDALVNTTSQACTGFGANWQSVLKTLFGGSDGTGSAAVCNASDRQALANAYSSTLGGCSGSSCTQFRHLFRRGDTTGTTDTFKSLVGLTGFCNGTEVQDNDPIRRPCNDNEAVCQGDGTLGLLLPIHVPATGAGATATDDKLWYRGSAGNANSVNLCATGKFAKVGVSFEDPACCIRKRMGDTSAASTCTVKPLFGKCYWPHTANRSGQTANAMCDNDLDDTCFDVNIPAPYASKLTDGRVFNLQARDSDSAHTVLSDIAGKEVSSAYFRIYWQASGGKAACGAKTGRCQQSDATSQIGCLSKAVSCNIAFDSDQARSVAGASPIPLAGQAPVNGSTLNTSYPAIRKLYLASLKGFKTGAISNAAQLSLAKCFATAATLNPVLTKWGFFPNLNNGSTPKCEDACGGADSCSGNPAPFQ